jgi:hypothetical protein
MELILILSFISTLVVIGIAPVIGQIHSAKNPSPWRVEWDVVEGMNEMNNETMTPDNQKVRNDTRSAEDQSGLAVNMLSSIELEQTGVENLAEFTPESVSEPDEDTWANVEKLIIEEPPVMESRNEQQMEEEQILTHEERKVISDRYGQKIAAMITATPRGGLEGNQVMIGTFFKENESLFLGFNDDNIQIVGDTPPDVTGGEVILIKGHVIEGGKFYVLHWEDPDMISYYSEEWNQHSVM